MCIMKLCLGESRVARQTDISEILKSLSKEELIRIILQAAERDDMFKNSLLVKYAEGDLAEELQSCKKLMDSIVNQYLGRDRFISYRETYSFAQDMLGLLAETDGAKDGQLALEIALLVLQEAVEAFQYADDSSGNIGMLAEEVLERIHALASAQDASHQERFFERLLAVSGSEAFEGWEDYRIGLLRICAGLAKAEKLRERLKAAIEEQIAVYTHDEYGRYTVETLLRLLFQLTREYGSEEEADKFVKEHLQYTFFRQSAIETCMKSGDYQRAVQLAQEGERQDRQLPGLLNQWKKARYEAYKKLSMKHEQRLLAKELLLGGDYAYYQELESLAEGSHEELYRGILAELKKDSDWTGRRIYLQLISDKNDLEEIMAYVRTVPSAIEEYAARLSHNYSEEVERIYRDHIYKTAGSSSNRKEYQQVRGMLTRYREIFGKTSQSEIILQLKEQYNRRPAFLDELSKVK